MLRKNILYFGGWRYDEERDCSIVIVCLMFGGRRGEEMEMDGDSGGSSL